MFYGNPRPLWTILLPKAMVGRICETLDLAVESKKDRIRAGGALPFFGLGLLVGEVYCEFAVFWGNQCC
jgi:hypothetical protein